jgi:hypothetical protein
LCTQIIGSVGISIATPFRAWNVINILLALAKEMTAFGLRPGKNLIAVTRALKSGAIKIKNETCGTQ